MSRLRFYNSRPRSPEPGLREESVEPRFLTKLLREVPGIQILFRSSVHGPDPCHTEAPHTATKLPPVLLSAFCLPAFAAFLFPSVCSPGVWLLVPLFVFLRLSGWPPDATEEATATHPRSLSIRGKAPPSFHPWTLPFHPYTLVASSARLSVCCATDQQKSV